MAPPPSSADHPSAPDAGGAASLSRGGRYLVLAVVFLGWMFAGVEMSLFPLATGSMIESFSSRSDGPAVQDEAGGVGRDERAARVVSKKRRGRWFAWYIAAFLLGAAAGGALFGQFGDRAGRVKAMGWSILCYSCVTGVGYFAGSPEQLLVLRLVACMGIGGMWPAGVSLVSEAWPDVSRPALAGLIGAAANVGILILGLIARFVEITPQSWRWVMLVGASPAPLGLFALLFAPESPRWLAARGKAGRSASRAPIAEVFRSPLLRRTVVGIFLGAIPLLGAWGASKWVLLWADDVGRALHDEALKGDTQAVWAVGATLGSLSGGWLASRFGRRLTYFLISLGAVLIAAYVFRITTPSRGLDFRIPIFLLGLVPTTFFGWLPLYLPELFPTRVRATGSGVCFNFGRIGSAIVVLSTVALVEAFSGQYQKVGAVTSLVYLAGMVVIWFAPQTAGEQLED